MCIAQFLSYTLTRVSCVKCGQFEHGSHGACIAVCPHCGSVLLLEMECKGLTSRPLPFTSTPRLPEKPKPEKADPNQGIEPGVGALYKPEGSGKIRNGKSTGRPRGGHGRGATNYRGEAHSKYQYEGKFVAKTEVEE